MWWRTPLMKPDIWHDPLFLAGLKGGGQGGSASGPIVTFTGDGSPLRSLRLAIDPVQDLHGYEYPWPAGGGKNLVNYLACVGVGVRDDSDSVNASVTVSSDVITMTGYASYQSGGQIFKGIGSPSITGAFTVSADVKCTTSSVAFGVGAYEGGGTSDVAANYSVTANTWTHISRTFTHKTYSKIGIFLQPKLGTDTLEVKNLQLELGSSATAFAPYSNLCPISGWDEANLWRTGKNVWDEELEIGGINNNTGQNNDSATSNMRSAHYVSVIPGEKYRIVCGAGTGGNLYWYDREKNFIRHISWAAGTVYTVPSNAAFARFITSTTYGTTYNHDISINYPSTDISYHAYTGTSYPITIPTEAGTVYGGYISVGADGSAELVVDRAMAYAKKVHFPNKATGTVMDYRNCSGFPPTASMVDWNLARQQQMSNMAKIANANTEGAYGNYVAVVLTLGSERSVGILRISEDLYQSMTDDDAIEVVYKLLNPLTYPLSNITVQTLAGTNVLWADAGDVTVEWAGGKGFGKEAMLAWVMHR